MAHAWKNKKLARAFADNGRRALPFGQEQIDIMIRLITAGVSDVRTYVDLGCGDGILSHALLTSFPNAKGVLLDYSEPMLKEANKRLSCYENQQIVYADMSNSDWLNFVIEPVDVVISGFAIHHLTHGRKYELYEEIYNCLASGGMFINMEHVASTSVWGERLFDEIMVDYMYQFMQEQGQNANKRELWEKHVNRPDKEDNILLSVETQSDWLREIGFYDVDCYFKCFEMAIFGGRKQ
ncbi:class I SAM-dependent methyltransferase [Paenibacillus tyrfis]|uniref:class I SAM-dependent methyltransferase n=1 Tax=Paenibacillus tyrfis TaxID=1501230 RepID=UPI000B5948AB|nr:class I SAM-dependent methyltransferase [Paenibacillus tyrfis]